MISKTEECTENAKVTVIPLSTSLTAVMQKISDSNANEITTSPNSNFQIADSNKGWFKRKRLAEFHPLTEKDADLLQFRSNREFNLSFINQLLLKLADQYPNHHFCNKKLLLVELLENRVQYKSKIELINY